MVAARLPAPVSIRWDGAGLAVVRRGDVVDRIASTSIRRVILVCGATRAGADTPGDLRFALVDTGDEHVLLPADSGIAPRIYFERQSWWTARSCIYWTTARDATLPRRLPSGLWLLHGQRWPYLRLPAAELQPLVDRWPLEGPQTWEQRRWARSGGAHRLRPVLSEVPRR